MEIRAKTLLNFTQRGSLPANLMKTQKQNSSGLHLKSNNRWKWMAGATAATAAGASASHAGLITVSLSNNYISPFGGNHLNPDLTGDGHPDLTIASASEHSIVGPYGSISFNKYYVFAKLNGVIAKGFASNDSYPHGYLQLGSRFATWYQIPSHTGGTRSLTGSIPIFFKDLHINGGAPTTGSLEVTVSNVSITLDSFTYNTPTLVERPGLTVPDQGSSLALLAMGAGGILALRRRRTAQGTVVGIY
jgi:protein with PEP-CTERM/exosortase system signal